MWHFVRIFVYTCSTFWVFWSIHIPLHEYFGLYMWHCEYFGLHVALFEYIGLYMYHFVSILVYTCNTLPVFWYIHVAFCEVFGIYMWHWAFWQIHVALCEYFGIYMWHFVSILVYTLGTLCLFWYLFYSSWFLVCLTIALWWDVNIAVLLHQQGCP